ncbi:iron-sulfur cluster carrier protein ApbC [Alkalilimnicola sp. S0819]|uniref:iron-sulfur cluster carrier protein ApbC n=1 Tax=Alkalilimnicola sp. S0819 TaxID=2613922 RepID=UPI0012613D1F|nr:iron-sulfur cluster carrier protein ApbC [Alkalilimnicola sp. S0819]KAB7623203.1 iron-sulfur cluster carrier protein ApbC [Alkalilimnicola sp. S0819]MPQ17050.1 iron-sulfur cluster carrier protein ApbC [Alkalilimnicola sp. S0819]
MSDITPERIEQALSQWVEPNMGRDLVSTGALQSARWENGVAMLRVQLPYPARGYRDELQQALAEQLRAALGVEEVQLELDWKIAGARLQQGGLQPLPQIRNIIAVASGKGGVGKSTTAVNLALALSAEGARCGVLDADIYGPSQPRMLGLSGRPESSDGKTMEPLENYGIQAMSIGFLVDEESPMVWRGPMVTQALTQLLNETRWRDLDYLIVDLPPGTGDIQLTLSQRVPVSGALIVTTPQDIALLDARKALKMFEKVRVPVLGVVENMSTHICSQCGHEEHIFGAGGGARMAADYEVDLLGALPLDIHIREQVDGGRPSVVADPHGRIARDYRAIARRAAARLALQTERKSAFPRIEVGDS